MIAPSAHIGAVHLRISELDRSIRFYQRHLGFAVHQSGAGRASLGAGGSDLLVLNESASAPIRPRGTSGLYHFAILVPSRADLARSLRLLAETRTPLQGVADHGVSESLYLADPDGNGIEIYRDRPRTEWPLVDGQLHMTTDPLDLNGLLSIVEHEHEHEHGHEREHEHPAPAPSTQHLAPSTQHLAPSTQHLAPSTRLGHVHLQVSHLDEARRFYVDLLGFELMQRFGPSALFVSAGGYHHHLGLNTWAGVGAPAPPPGAIGLDYFEVKLPDRPALDDLVARVKAAGVPIETRGRTALVRDPSANGILLTL